MDDKLKKYIEERLSVRARNVLRANNLQTIDDLTPWIYGEEGDFLALRNCGKRSNGELLEMVKWIKAVSVSGMDEEEVVSENNEECGIGIPVEELYPHLSVRARNALRHQHIEDIAALQKLSLRDMMGWKHCGKKIAQEIIEAAASWQFFHDDFARNFNEQYGHLPVFYISALYLDTVPEQERNIIYDYWGINEGVPSSIEELSCRYGLTTVRVHQIINKTYARLMCFCEPLGEEWQKYDVYGSSYIEIAEMSRILQLENLSQTYLQLVNFFGMALGYGDLSCNFTTKYTPNQKPLLVFEERYTKYGFRYFFAEIQRLQKTKRVSDIIIPIAEYFIKNSAYSKIPFAESEQSVIYDILCFSLNEMGCQTINGCLVLRSNSINISDIVYGILKEKGEPMPLKDIAIQVGVKKYDLQSKLSSDARIVPIGKSGYWTLSEWETDTGSIRELVTRNMRGVEKPLPFDTIVKKVQSDRPTSSYRSIAAVTRTCIRNGEFVQFFGDYIGEPDVDYGEDYILFPKSFQEWIGTFEQFVKQHNRFPSSKNSYEGHLYRWYNRCCQYTDLSAEEINEFENLRGRVEKYPHNATEVDFLEKCNMYYLYVQQHHKQPSRLDNEELEKWFHTYSRKADRLEGNKKNYFDQLLTNLSPILL